MARLTGIKSVPALKLTDEHREYVMRVLAEHAGNAVVGIDCEADTANPKEPNPMRDELVGVGFSLWYRERGPHIETFYGDLREVPWLRFVLQDFMPGFPYYAHNALYDTTLLRRYGIRLGTLEGDGRIAAYLLGQPEAGLKPLLEEWFGYETIEFTDVLKAHGATKISEVPPEFVARYCGEQDAQMCVPLARAMQDELPARVRAVYEKVELPMCGILVDMTMRGIRFDREAAVPLLEQALAAQDGLDKAIADMVRATGFTQYEMKDGLPYRRVCPGCRNGSKKRLTCELCKGEGLQPVKMVDFNPGSHEQLRRWLYQHMKFPMRRYANNVQPWQIERGLVNAEDVEGSTDALALLQLQDAHPVIPMILARRKFAKDAGFLRAWMKASEKDGRIHAQITNTTVVSGRLSMRDPNLQQVKLPHRVLFTADVDGAPEVA